MKAKFVFQVGKKWFFEVDLINLIKLSIKEIYKVDLSNTQIKRLAKDKSIHITYFGDKV